MKFFIYPLSLSLSQGPDHEDLLGGQVECRCQEARSKWILGLFSRGFPPQKRTRIGDRHRHLPSCELSNHHTAKLIVKLHQFCHDNDSYIISFEGAWIYMLIAFVVRIVLAPILQVGRPGEHRCWTWCPHLVHELLRREEWPACPWWWSNQREGGGQHSGQSRTQKEEKWVYEFDGVL